VFTHEAGIHVDGLMKDRRNYQGLDPAELGRDHQLVLGKHSGGKMLRSSYRDLNIELLDWQVPVLLSQLRVLVTATKRSPQAGELMDMYLALDAVVPDTLSAAAMPLGGA